MKAKLIFGFIFSMFAISEVRAEDAGLRLILTRGKILCGTDLEAKTYAFKDEEENWRGIDVAMCRTFSNAIFGRGDRIEMVNVQANEIESALNLNKIDVMLGGSPYSATIEIEKKYANAGLLYYDKQLFLAKRIEGVTSMEGYKGKRICVVAGSEDFDNVQHYSEKYGLELKLLMFPSFVRAKEAFFLKRCDLMTGNEIYLKGILKNEFTDQSNLMIIPDTLGVKPSFAFVHKNNETLRLTIKWILNAMMLAEEKGITSANVEAFAIGPDDTTQKNLMGADVRLWNRFKLDPTWVKINIKEQGNFGEIYEKNLGEESELKIPREENKLIKDGGLVPVLPFV